MKYEYNLGKVLLTPRGDYSNSEFYEPLDFVTYNNSSYVAKAKTNGHLPTDTGFWQLLASGPDMNDFVPVTRTINGYELSSNVDLTAKDVDALPDTTFIPKSVSELINDKGYTSVQVDSRIDSGTYIAGITIDGETTHLYVPQERGEENTIETVKVNGVALTPDAEKAVDVEVPTKTSDLTNDSGFITKIVNDLTNYYLKSETYTKSEVAALIGAIQQFHYEIYTTLPQTGQGNVLYLIGPTGSGSDKYEEYVYSNSAFTKIGDTSIDLSGYVTTNALNTELAGYATTQDLDDAKVFWAEVDVTPFEDIKEAVEAGKVVLLNDDNGYIYHLLYNYGNTITFFYASAEDAVILSYNVYNNNIYELISLAPETQNNKVTSISSSSDNNDYPSARAVYQALQSYTPTSNLATVATSGSYNDLANKPTIPAAQIQSDWSQSDNTAKDFIKNKPTIPTVPTNVSAFTNDAGYLTQHQSLANYVQKSQTAGLLKNDGTVDQTQYGTYSKPSTGIPASDLASGVIPTVPVQDVTVGGTSVLSNGVAAVPSIPDISGKADKTLVDTSMPSGGFLPNVVYNLGEIRTNTTFLLSRFIDNTIANIWCWTFSTGTTAPTITWPSEITEWSGGARPTINESKSYEVSVMNGLATIIES